MFKYIQRTFGGGQLDASLMGRQDLQKYFKGASVLKNFLVRRQGNIAKRRGTDRVAGLTNLLGLRDGAQIGFSAHRIIPIVQEREKGYYAIIADRRAFLVDPDKGVYCSDGAWRRDIAPYEAPDTSGAIASESDFSMQETFVARIGIVTYSTFADAAAAAKAGDTITLGADVEISANTTVKGLIDLAGHKITVNDAYTLTFNPGSDSAECGIISTAANARIEWADGLTTTGSNQFIKHSSGILRLEDFTADHPYTGASACFVYSSAKDTQSSLRLLRCDITARGGYGVIYLNGTVTGQSQYVESKLWSAGCRIEGCTIAYESSTAGNCPLRTSSITSENVRRFSFVSGTIDCPGHPAARIGLFVYGGVIKADAIGTVSNTAYASALSRIVRGLSSAQIAAGYIAAGSVEAAETKVVDGVGGFYSYSAAGEDAYSQSDNTWPAAEYSNAGGESSPEDRSAKSLVSGAAPYCIALPYADGELEEIDWCQSGDTVFFAHPRHNPACLEFSAASLTLSFRTIKFNAAAWLPPAISGVQSSVHPATTTVSVSGTTATKTDVQYSANSTVKTTTVSTRSTSSSSSVYEQKASCTSNLPARTVHYVATYVKNGMESAPSRPVEVTYGAPWEEGGTITLTLQRGANAEEPDYYNIYKMESTGYGLVGSTARTVSVAMSPRSVYGYLPKEYIPGASKDFVAAPGMAATLFYGAAAYAATDLEDVAGALPADAFDGETASPAKGVRIFAGCGGMRFGQKAMAVFDFGTESGIVADTVEIAFDCHSLGYTQLQAGTMTLSDSMVFAGAYARVSVWHEPVAGTERARAIVRSTFALPAAAYKPDPDSEPVQAVPGEAVRICGDIPQEATRQAVRAKAAMPLRTVKAVFPGLSSGDRQIYRITVECFADADCTQPCEVAMAGIRLSKVAATANTFTDDYITPDMSLTPPSGEDSFSARGEYPSCVGLYQQRLVYAASLSRPFAFWMSAIGDLYTFVPHDSIREDDALSAELAAMEFPRINHIVFNRDLVMLTDGGEWRIAPVSGNTLTYKTLSATLQSSIGSAKWLKPLAVGNEIVFADRTGMTLRSVVYNYASDGYESQDLSILSADIFADNPVRRMCYKQHPDSTILCVLSDGSIAAFVYMAEHEVSAWSRHVLGGGALALDIASSKALNGNTTDCVFTIRRGAGTDVQTELWRVRPDSAARTVRAQACMDGCRVLSAADAAAGWQDGWRAVDLLTGAVHATFDTLEAGRDYICGFPFEAEFVTVRPESPQGGSMQFEIKNAKSAEVRLLCAGAWRIAANGWADHPVYAQHAENRLSAQDGELALEPHDRTLVLSGANSPDGRIQLKSGDPFPLSILSIGVNYEIQPLSNSEG